MSYHIFNISNVDEHERNINTISLQDPAFKRRFGSAAEKPPKKLRNLDLSWKEQNKRIRYRKR